MDPAYIKWNSTHPSFRAIPDLRRIIEMRCGMCGWRLILRDRHDRQPTQVLPLDTANRLALFRLCHCCASHARNCGIHDRCEYTRRNLQGQGTDTRMTGQVGHARKEEGRSGLGILDSDHRYGGHHEAEKDVYIGRIQHNYIQRFYTINGYCPLRPNGLVKLHSAAYCAAGRVEVVQPVASC